MPLPSTEHGRYFIDARVVKIKLDDGTLYQVFRHFFEQHSPIFVEEYLSNEDADYIHLADVTRIDFDRFLSLMYPSALGKCDVKTPEEWISVLRLATKWSFVDLRVLAIGQLRFDATPIDRIAAARELDVPEWLLPAFIDVCMAPKWLTQEDAERLGLSTVVEIGRIREEMHKAFERSYYDRWTPMDVEKAIIAANLAPTPPRPDTFNLDGYQSSWVSRVTTPDALSPVRTPWMCSRDGLGSLVLTPEERVAHGTHSQLCFNDA
ncbi:hypothetical protein BD626DRAFT_391988 [Schizophyllum amplum]|uniref:BTB domain-containing protein n=1 Tax=Schizophyllum amplum TaxID=97359 RepID=A0A550CVQ3_9AGAR|nr:hypothetical protein BD626DRAFT_391988 [Auriculariopsis ampla]